MANRVKLEDVAKECGVSPATVSLALNDNPLVNVETKRRVKEAADRMGYIPNEIARSLVKKKSQQLGVIVPDILNCFYATFVSELNRFVQSNHYGLTISISDNNPDRERRIVDELIRSNVEGVIIVPTNEQNTAPLYINKLSKLKIPFLFAVDKYEEIEAQVIMSDCEQGMYDMVTYLIAKGYSDIAFLSGDTSVFTLRARADGYRKAMDEAGLENKMIRAETIDYNGACKAIEQCIEKNQLHRVFVCPNDMMALGVINTLRNHNISVPEQCAVTGYDNVMFSTISTVPITTVEQDICTIAQNSARTLFDMIGEQRENIGDKYIKTKLIIRESC